MRMTPTYLVVNDRGQTVSLVLPTAFAFVGNEVLIESKELVLPRHSKNVRLRLHQWDEDTKSVCVGEFKLAVSPRREVPLGKPEPLPIRRVDGELEVALTQFTAENEVRANRGFVSALHTLTFQVSTQGQRTTNWQLRTIEASDALGNRNIAWVASFLDRNGDETWFGPWLLWPDEPAWRLRLEFARRSGFAPDELWHVQDIPVPGNDAFTSGSFQTNLQGVGLSVRGISDAQGFLPDGTMSLNVTSNMLNMTWTPSPPGLSVSLLEVQDDHGQNVQVAASMGGTRGVVCYRLNLASPAHFVDALIAVRRSRFVEFLVKPER